VGFLLQVQDIMTESWQLNYDELEIIHPPVAKGGFGIVNRAIHHDTIVAVKVGVVAFECEWCVCATPFGDKSTKQREQDRVEEERQTKNERKEEEEEEEKLLRRIKESDVV
jgi:hypothetical protein